ncbi:MAG: hypothetical protein VZR56_12775 [Treponema sp.]|nr:hypothetical protein [Treponema sp.]
MKSTTTLTSEQIRRLVEQKKEENRKRLLARASKKITPEQGLYIKYRLKCMGISGADIALEVGCTPVSVSDVLSGKSHSQRIERVVASKLGYPSWNAMVQTLREMAA